MKELVYVVFFEGESHDDDYIEGVYASQAKAKAVAKNLRTDYNRVTVTTYIVIED